MRTKTRLALAFVTCLAAVAAAQTAASSDVVRLATTTSTDDTGLLKAILPAFEKLCSCRVDVVAVGTGQALELGRRGDADVVLVHSYRDEVKFVADRHARERLDIMYNDFVIVGPAADPAKVAGRRSARGGVLGDCGRPGAVRKPRRQVGDSHRRTRALGFGEGDAGWLVVPVARAGNGGDAGSGEREAGLHDVGPGHLAVNAREAPGSAGARRRPDDRREPRFGPAQPLRRDGHQPRDARRRELRGRTEVRRVAGVEDDATRNRRLRREAVRPASLLPGFGRVEGDRPGQRQGRGQGPHAFRGGTPARCRR